MPSDASSASGRGKVHSRMGRADKVHPLGKVLKVLKVLSVVTERSPGKAVSEAMALKAVRPGNEVKALEAVRELRAAREARRSKEAVPPRVAADLAPATWQRSGTSTCATSKKLAASSTRFGVTIRASATAAARA
jgi:hypothetical protein